MKKIYLCLICMSLIPSILFAAQDRYMLSGEGIIRFRYVETDSQQITGSYGETLNKGLSFRQRYDLALDVFITDFLTIGGAVRISNEDSKRTFPPPDLVSTQVVAGWWSVNFYQGPFDVMLGAYETSFTPFTLMRWDQNDNPLGAAGCGCQVAIGGIGLESLEELKEDYRFEGAKAKYQSRIGDVTIIYARPEMASETETYKRHMYGGHGRIILPYTRGFSTLTIGFTGIRAQDDTLSADQATYDPMQSDVFGVDINIPLFWNLSCFGEYARSIRDDNLLSNIDVIHSENGIMAGLKIAHSDVFDANALYMQLDPYFSPLYRALSYAKNRRGFRGAFTFRKIPLFSNILSVSLYAKLLREIKPTWNETITEWHSSLSDQGVGNVAATYSFWDRWKAESSYEYRRTQRGDDGTTLADELIDLQTHVISLALYYEFTLQTKIMLKYQWINNIDGTGQNDYLAHIPMLQFIFKF